MIQELHAGDRQIPASGWNEMRAAVQGITAPQQQYQSGKLNPVYVTIKNQTGAALPAFSVVKINGATYSSRTGDTFINQAIANGVELNGDTPAAATDTIAITQVACASGEFVKAIVSGATAATIHTTSSKKSRYAKPAAGQAGYLEASDTPTNIQVIWRGDYVSGKTDYEAYVTLDAIDDRERFLLKASSSVTPSDYVKGNLAYIIWSASDNAWIPINSFTDNVEPGRVRLVVCQEDCPATLTADYYMPYYALEDNLGVAPNRSTATADIFTDRCGVAPGEHVLSNKRFDYSFKYGRYSYEPKFVLEAHAEAHGGGNSGVYVTINNTQYPVLFPAKNSNFSLGTMAPDVYAGDEITVQVETSLRLVNNTHVYAVDYPIDFIEHYVMFTLYGSQGWRGWVDVTTDYIPANNPSSNYSESLMFIKHWGNSSVINSCAAADARQQFGVFDLPIKFYKKVKTNALI